MGSTPTDRAVSNGADWGAQRGEHDREALPCEELEEER